MPPLDIVLSVIAQHYECDKKQAMSIFDSLVQSGQLGNVVKLLSAEVTNDVAQIQP